jgi:hypothetical protein
MASFESPVKLNPSNPKNRVSLMEFGLTWLQKKQSSETQKVVAVLLVLQGKRRPNSIKLTGFLGLEGSSFTGLSKLAIIS